MIDIARFKPQTEQRLAQLERGTFMSDHSFGLKPFMTHPSMRLRITLLLLAAAALAHAVTFGPPTSSFDTHDDNCQYANYGPGGGGTSITGSVTNGGSGLTLSGNDSFQGYGANGVCHLTFDWQGTASGSSSGIATVTPNFTLTVPADVTITCSVTVTINGIQESQLNCTEAPPGGTYSLPPQSFSVPPTPTSYLVQLAITATWSPSSSSPFSTVSVNVPADASIDILAGNAPPVVVPVLSPSLLVVTGVLLVIVGWFAVWRRTTALAR
jgi:hypothetical protein